MGFAGFQGSPETRVRGLARLLRGAARRVGRQGTFVCACPIGDRTRTRACPPVRVQSSALPAALLEPRSSPVHHRFQGAMVPYSGGTEHLCDAFTTPSPGTVTGTVTTVVRSAVSLPQQHMRAPHQVGCERHSGAAAGIV